MERSMGDPTAMKNRWAGEFVVDSIIKEDETA
jgi:hypothetical protein